jgi:hypothetical protein
VCASLRIWWAWCALEAIHISSGFICTCSRLESCSPTRKDIILLVRKGSLEGKNRGAGSVAIMKKGQEARKSDKFNQ